MNLSEFKAWFEGFTESMDGPPGEKAWKRIQARVKEIKDAPATSYPVYIDRYWNYGAPWWGYTAPHWQRNTYGSLGGSSCQDAIAQVQNTQPAASLASAKHTACNPPPVAFNASNAFRALGRADAENMN